VPDYHYWPKTDLETTTSKLMLLDGVQRILDEVRLKGVDGGYFADEFFDDGHELGGQSETLTVIPKRVKG
jgi:hypothetical protein